MRRQRWIETVVVLFLVAVVGSAWGEPLRGTVTQVIPDIRISLGEEEGVRPGMMFRVFDLAKAGYVRELVEARNKISHGAVSPRIYGVLKRGSDLQLLFNSIRQQAFYILDCFDEYVTNQAYRSGA